MLRIIRIIRLVRIVKLYKNMVQAREKILRNKMAKEKELQEKLNALKERENEKQEIINEVVLHAGRKKKKPSDKKQVHVKRAPDHNLIAELEEFNKQRKMSKK